MYGNFCIYTDIYVAYILIVEGSREYNGIFPCNFESTFTKTLAESSLGVPIFQTYKSKINNRLNLQGFLVVKWCFMCSCWFVSQQQKTALMRNNSALQNVTLRTRSKNFSETHICTCYVQLVILLSFIFFQPLCLFSYSTSFCSLSLLCCVLFLTYENLLFHSSRNAWASKFSHLSFWKLPTVPAGIPPWSLQPNSVQKCVHQQHCRVSLTFIGQQWQNKLRF